MIQANKSWAESDWDSKNSRYKSEIYFINGKMKDGYSGKVGHPEPQDHLVQWQQWVLRLYKAGYLNPKYMPKENSKVDRIVFYMKDETGNYGLHFITLYPMHAGYNTDLYIDEIGRWVNLFYSLVEKGIDPSYKLSTKAKKAKIIPPDVNKREFINKRDLRNHAIHMFNSKYFKIGFIQDFYRVYVSKWFEEGFTESDEVFLQNLLKGGF